MTTATISKTRSGKPELSEELYQAAICMEERIRALQSAGWIGNEGESMEIGDGCEMETGGKSSTGWSSAASLELEELLHRAAILTQTRVGDGNAENEELLDLAATERIVGQAGNPLSWELISAIMPEFEAKVGDIASVLQVEETRKEAVAVLSFGFRLRLFSEQIDELRHEMCNFLRSFSSENKNIRSTMMKFISEPYLSRISKLLISDSISMLQRMDSDFDSKVKSTIIKLKSESFLSAMEDELHRAGQEDSVEMEEKRFAAYHLYWERIWGKDGHSFEKQSPVRAIVSTDTVYIEIQLTVKGATKSEDTALISTFGFFNGDNSSTYLAKNNLCIVELCYEQVKQLVQATVLSVGVIPKPDSLPFPHGGRVVCSSLPQDGHEDIAGQVSSRQVLLLDSKDGKMPMTSNGYLDLARHVVSVELNGKLQFLIMADSPSHTATAARFLLTPEKYNTSKCENPLVDGSKVEITVAWSLVPSTMPESGDSPEDSGMATAGNSKGKSSESMFSEDLCQAGIFMQKSICWIQDQEKKLVKIGHYGSEEYNNLLVLKSDMYELSNKIFNRVNYKTQKRICTMQNAYWINNNRKLIDTERKMGDDIEMETGGKLLKGRSGEFKSAAIGNEDRTVQTQRKIGDCGKSDSKQFNEQEQFKELPVSNSIPMAVSVRNKIEEEAEAETVMAEVAPRVSFKSALLSQQFDELWDNMSQLVSTEPKFLAICMLIQEPVERYCSTLKFISAVFDRLGQWVPDFREKMELIKEDKDRDKDVEAEDAYEATKMAEEYYFNAYRRDWECRRGNFGSFEDPTLLSPMYFIDSIPGHTQVGAKVGRTMQVYSIKVAEREGFTLEWPLKVYGVVAARDSADYCCNLLFFRTRDDYQILTKQDPFLHLTGPSRAIMSRGIMEPTVTIEVHLKLKGTVESKDRTLINKAFFYDEKYLDSGDMISTRQLEHSHQANILGVRVVRGSLPCGNGINRGGKHPSGCILLLDSQARDMPVGEEGYLDLSRQVVSVKSRGRLEILVQAREISGSVVFPIKFNNIREESCELGDCKVEITVAWSLLVENQYDISVMGAIQPYAWESIPRRPIMKLVDAC
ncbi:hypothetical protein VPH35_031969 [Triticum aestivum]